MPIRAAIAALLLVLLAFIGVPTARAGEPLPPHKITYDLSLDGKPIGTRELTIRYLPRGDGERRIIESYTDATVLGQPLVCRSSGQSSTRGATFTTSVDQGGAVSQVQGIELPGGGWRVTVADAAGVKETTLTKEQARLTSLDLLDPGRTVLLTGGGELTLVLVETGTVLTGTLDAGTVGTTKVAGQKVEVTRYTATGVGGTARFDVDASGLLVKSELSWLGGTVTAVAREVPPPRSYGVVETIEALTPAVTEDPL
ncbi:MAG: hypothetical protein Q8P41_19015 [Pseudomonadota bacterium]|nr:hypothetical protein [Pseudomonadota bacterium]